MSDAVFPLIQFLREVERVRPEVMHSVGVPKDEIVLVRADTWARRNLTARLVQSSQTDGSESFIARTDGNTTTSRA